MAIPYTNVQFGYEHLLEHYALLKAWVRVFNAI